MIICKNNNWKLNKWFSIAEIVVSVSILAIVSIWVFNIYKVIQNQNSLLTQKTIVFYFWDYLSNIIRKTQIPENFNVVWNPFYIFENINSEIIYTWNPAFNNTSWGFFYWLSSENERYFYHEIFYLGSNNIDWVDFNHYKINTSFNWNKNTFYITK